MADEKKEEVKVYPNSAWYRGGDGREWCVEKGSRPERSMIEDGFVEIDGPGGKEVKKADGDSTSKADDSGKGQSESKSDQSTPVNSSGDAPDNGGSNVPVQHLQNGAGSNDSSADDAGKSAALKAKK